MSQPAICNKCKEAGFDHELIKFEKNGKKPDGSIKWRPLNQDGTEHVHKTKPGDAATSASNEAKVDPMTDLTAAIRELVAAIRSRPL